MRNVTKTRRLIYFVFILLVAGNISIKAQTNAAVMTEFNAVGAFDPFNVFQNGSVGYYIDPVGTLLCPGFEPTGDPAQPCPSGSRIHWTGLKWVARVSSADARFNGWMTVDVGVHWAPDLTGPISGRYRIDLDNSGGTWTGVCSGQFTRVGGQWIENLHCYGHGDGGIVDGQQALFSTASVRYTVVAYIHNYQGFIIDPNIN